MWNICKIFRFRKWMIQTWYYQDLIVMIISRNLPAYRKLPRETLRTAKSRKSLKIQIGSLVLSWIRIQISNLNFDQNRIWLLSWTCAKNSKLIYIMHLIPELKSTAIYITSAVNRISGVGSINSQSILK